MCRSGSHLQTMAFSAQCEDIVGGDDNDFEGPAFQRDSQVQTFHQAPHSIIKVDGPSVSSVGYPSVGPDKTPHSVPGGCETARVTCASPTNSDNVSLEAQPIASKGPDWNGQASGVRGIRFSQIMGGPMGEGQEDDTIKTLEMHAPTSSVVMPSNFQDDVVPPVQGSSVTWICSILSMSCMLTLCISTTTRQPNYVSTAGISAQKREFFAQQPL